jgi:type I restriction enzyme S subunit
MNKLNDLLLKAYRQGVPYKSLSDVTEIRRGSTITKSQTREGDIPVLAGGQQPAYFHNESNREGESIVVAGSGAYAGFVTYWNSPIFVSDAFTVNPHADSLLTKFCYYFIKNLQTEIHGMKSGGGVPHVYGKDVGKLRIPVPPIEIQQEIVEILDKFTELETELKAELEARQTQYQYFCNSLFTFKEGETEELAVKHICRISRGTVISKDYLRDRPGEFPVYSSQTLNNGIFGYIDTFAYDFESLTWTTDGANAGSIFFHQNEKFTITNVCGLLQVLDPSRVSARYLYYVLRTEAPKHVSAGMGNPKLMAGTMGDVKLRIPSMERQLEVVAILDKFDALLNDISVGLPAEISARKLQYEYYRNRLLTFSELDVA